MWDWRSMTSEAGYKQEAPPYYYINDRNHTGKRLYWFLGHKRLQVTNACRELVSGPSERGTPDPSWLARNLIELVERFPVELVLVCGNVAQETYRKIPKLPIRTVFIPHPAARNWSRESLDLAQFLIRSGKQNLQLRIVDGTLKVSNL